MTNSTEVDAVVVGAGLAGLYQLYRFRNLGLSTRVIEAADGVGGTWYWNRYPGARCDVFSMLYSYSFSPELEQEWNWTEKYTTQPEILRYINHVADRFDLRKDITFNTRVTSAIYNDTSKRWEVLTDKGEIIGTQYLIMATGCLSASKMPEVPGTEKFPGPSYHTGNWPHKEVDFTGQRVAVIGTGSSGVQSIPIIAKQASQLTVFQRTPNFSMPARNRPLTEDEVANMKANYRAWRDEQRNSFGGFAGLPPPTQSALEASEEDRNARYQAAWERGTLDGFPSCYTDLVTNKEANETVSEFVRQKIRSIVKDPEVAGILTPRSYPLGTKRMCLDSGYYETFNAEHVHLVDLRKTPLVEITEKGVRTSEREYEVDAIVYATGYDALTGALTRIDIRGKGGVVLKEKWAKGPRTYLGVAISGFPNLFTITGPLSPSVLSTMIISIEQHVDWITDCISFLRERGIAEIDATVEAEDAWVEHAMAVANSTLFPSVASLFTGSNVLNKPRFFMPYVGGVGVYRRKCSDVAAKGYEGFSLTSA